MFSLQELNVSEQLVQKLAPVLFFLYTQRASLLFLQMGMKSCLSRAHFKTKKKMYKNDIILFLGKLLRYSVNLFTNEKSNKNVLGGRVCAADRIGA